MFIPSFYAIPVMLATAFLIPIVSVIRVRFTAYTAMIGSFLSFLLTIFTIPLILKNTVLSFQMEGWRAPFGITIAIDSFSMLVIFLIAFVGFLAIMFSKDFIKERETKYYSLMCIMLAGMLGIAHTGDLFNLFVFFEVMSISSYALTSYYRNEKSFEGAIKYLILGSFSTSLILFGAAFLYGATGTLNMADLALKIAAFSTPILPIALGLLLTGFGFKAAIFPFHTWKPDVVSAAPATVSALFATCASAIGIYAIFRIVFTVFALSSAMIFGLIIIAGIMTMFVGAVLALQQRSLMRMLAYSSISQSGYVLIALGVGFFAKLGYAAAVFHLFNVIIFEALLFFVAGVIISKTGTSDMQKLGGMAKYSPILAYAFLIGILANVGIPLLNGFSSKFLIYIATLQSFPVLTLLTIIVSVLTLMYCLRAYYLVFLGNKKVIPERISKSMLIPIVILSVICIFFGVLPWIGFQMSDFIVQGFNNALYVKTVLGV